MRRLAPYYSKIIVIVLLGRGELRTFAFQRELDPHATRTVDEYIVLICYGVVSGYTEVCARLFSNVLGLKPDDMLGGEDLHNSSDRTPTTVYPTSTQQQWSSAAQSFNNFLAGNYKGSSQSVKEGGTQGKRKIRACCAVTLLDLRSNEASASHEELIKQTNTRASSDAGLDHGNVEDVCCDSRIARLMKSVRASKDAAKVRFPSYLIILPEAV